MSRWRRLLTLLPVALACVLLAAPRGCGEAALCTMSPAELAAWRDGAVRQLLTPTRQAGGERYLEVDRVARLAWRIQEGIAAAQARCPERLGEGTPGGAVVANLKRFAAAAGISSLPDHKFGFRVADRTYLDTVRRDIALPAPLTSQEFLAAVSDPARYRQAQQIVDRRNAGRPLAERWVTLLYKSRFLKTPDRTTYGRFFIYIPADERGAQPEQWVQFGIATPDMRDHKRKNQIFSLSVVAVRRPPAAAPPGSPVVTAVVDHWRVYKPDGTIELQTRLEAGHETENCYDCHKVAVLPIHPLAEYGFGADGRLVVKGDGDGEIPRWLNDKIAAYGPPDFGGDGAGRRHMDTAGFGPALGPVGAPRPDEQLARCAAPVGAASFPRLREAMQCARCHSPTLLGNINYPQALRSDQDLEILLHPTTGASMPLVPVHVAQGWMPPMSQQGPGPAPRLTPEERAAVARCLTGEYYDAARGTGLLADWLRGRAAASTPNAAGAAGAAAAANDTPGGAR